MKAPSEGTASLVLQGKVQPRHLDRLAIVYVRQSTLQQLEQHRESTALQYGLAERACRLGWPRPRVSVIDDDLGCSGASAEGRPGFQRMVAEVGLGRVGLVLGFEVSRLARSCRDWYHLLEICALAGTLIADSDGVYDPALYNDRLLLGLKGTMSEAELHIMRARLEQGRWHKAERGELGFNLPRGYLRRASGEVTSTPTSGSATPSTSSSMSSRGVAVSMACCATWSTTASLCPTATAAGRPVARSSGGGRIAGPFSTC